MMIANVNRALNRALKVIALSACASVAVADISTDYYIQNDLASVAQQGEDSIAGYYQRQIDWLLEQGYAPASVILSSVGRGLTLADSVYFMSHSQPENAEKFYLAAEALLPSLPGWACSTDSAMSHRYDSALSLEDMSEQPTLAEVSRLYFDEYQRFMHVPDWENGVGHLNVAIDELLEVKQTEINLVSEGDDREDKLDSWWYLEPQQTAAKVVVASLYPRQRRVLLDLRQGALQALKDSGVKTMPVLVMYNELTHIPTSDIERVPGETYGGSTKKQDQIDYIDADDGEITASEVIRRYEDDGLRLSPSREWRRGDYHLQVRVAELLELFDVPEKNAIRQADWQAAQQQIEQQQPVHMTLYGDIAGERWLDDTAIVRVAAESGVERLPMVFFYHDISRQPCGLPAGCLQHVKKAAGLPPLLPIKGKKESKDRPRPELLFPKGGKGPVSPN